MKEGAVLNKIEKLIDSLDYKNAYVEIQTNENKFMIEKNKKNKIGFDTQEIK